MKTLFYSFLIASTLLFSCHSERKISPKDLISRIKNTGVSVQKGRAIAAFAQGSEAQFWIYVNKNKISAYLFESPEIAKIKSESFRKGYSNGYWAFAFVEDETIKILNKAFE